MTEGERAQRLGLLRFYAYDPSAALLAAPAAVVGVAAVVVSGAVVQCREQLDDVRVGAGSPLAQPPMAQRQLQDKSRT